MGTSCYVLCGNNVAATGTSAAHALPTLQVTISNNVHNRPGIYILVPARLPLTTCKPRFANCAPSVRTSRHICRNKFSPASWAANSMHDRRWSCHNPYCWNLHITVGSLTIRLQSRVCVCEQQSYMRALPPEMCRMPCHRDPHKLAHLDVHKRGHDPTAPCHCSLANGSHT